MSRFSRLTEARIRKAQADGTLDRLEGAGKPLPYRPEEVLLDAGETVGFRIMAEAGALPEEIGLKRQLAEARAAWQAAEGASERKAAMARMAEVQMRYEIARDARRKFLR